MSKRCLPSIEARPKLGRATKKTSSRKGMGTDTLGKDFSGDTAEHDVPVIAQKCRRPFVLKQLMQNSTTPLKGGGGTKQTDLKIRENTNTKITWETCGKADHKHALPHKPPDWLMRFHIDSFARILRQRNVLLQE